MPNPSKHLSWAELACKDGTPYPLNFVYDNRLASIVQAFETIRSVCGDRQIVVLSAYRTPEHNKKIGGAKNSQHVEGRALDLRPPEGMKVYEFYNIIKEIADRIYLGGIGKYATFVHIDTRPRIKNHLAIWYGSGLKDDH